jgi:hypothetical protein
MMDRYPASHLVVGYVGLGDDVMWPTRLIRRLLETQRSQHFYAVMTTLEPKGPIVRCAFEDRFDADRFADACSARYMSHHPGWESQRWFVLDAETTSAIEEALATYAGIDRG